MGLIAIATLGRAPNMGPPPASELAALPNHWDASWYVGLANGGYRWTPDERPVRIAFFPAYPMTLRAVGRALRLPSREPPWLWTGVGLSLAFFSLGLFYLSRLTALLTTHEGATVRVVWIAACYPFSLFYGQVYTESLFLAAAAGSWYYALRHHMVPSVLWGVTAGLTRQTGCLLSLLLAWTLFDQWRRGTLGPRPWTRALTVASPVIGLAAYATYIRWLTGDWLGWVTAQRAFGREPRNPLENISDVASRLWHSGLFDYVATYPYEAVNLLAALFVLAALLPMARRLGVGCALFVGASLLVPLAFGGLMSMGRFTSVMFPIFIWLATTTAARAPLLGLFAISQGLLATQFFTDRPVF